jgi:hypothetical protein
VPRRFVCFECVGEAVLILRLDGTPGGPPVSNTSGIKFFRTVQPLRASFETGA